MKLIKTANYEELSRRAAQIIAAQITVREDSVLGLATGSTPIGIYQQLVALHQAGGLDFSAVSSVNLDEYCGLSPDHDQSYRYFMNLHLFSKVNIDLGRTHVPNGLAADDRAEGARYDALIRSLGGVDLQLLGLGHNGHIGFNEPGELVGPTHRVTLTKMTIDANARLFDSPDEVPRFAITMGLAPIMAARRVLLVASGADKADIFYRALRGPITPDVPASILQLHPNLIAVGDEASMAKFDS